MLERHWACGAPSHRTTRYAAPHWPAVQLTGEGVGAPDDWCFAHPDTAAHEALAGQVVAFVQATMPWFSGGGSCTAGAQE